MEALTETYGGGLFWSLLAITLIVAVILARLFIYFRSYTQPSEIAFVRDDSKEERLDDILTGTNDPDTRLFTDCATLCANIYRPSREYVDTDDLETLGNRRLVVDGWTEIDLDQWRSGGAAGLAYELWRNEEHRIVALVFRGTVFSASSWLANFHWLFRYIPFVVDQYDQIKGIVPDIVASLSEEASDGYVFVATGHSLGGGLAQHSLYLDPKIETVFAFNAAPTTSWSDVKRWRRTNNVSGNKIYRIHENGEVLEFFRLLVKIGYVFNPTPNVDPYFVEYRLNLRRGGIVEQHGITSLACALRTIHKAALRRD